MRHFTAGRWADFLRGLGGASERAAMEAHLASGCRACGRMITLLDRFARIARAEQDREPPEQVLRRAQALCPTPASRPQPSWVEALARLVYDSARDPLPAGVRASQRPGLALYEGSDWAVDLQVIRERGGRGARPWLAVIGQVVDRRPGWRAAPELPVVLLTGGEVVARTVTNTRGEFHLDCEPRQGLRLQVCLEGERRIEVPVQPPEEAGE